MATSAGCGVETLRYYERRGLLRKPGRTDSGYRQYPPDTVRIVRFIKRAQELGFTLHEVEELLRLRAGEGAGRRQVRAIAEAKMRDIAQKQARLDAIHRALDGLLKSCANRGSGRNCPILNALNDGSEEA